MKIGLLATIGLPGSGKTSFCSKLSQLGSFLECDGAGGPIAGEACCESSSFVDPQIVHISYDELQHHWNDIGLPMEPDFEMELTAYRIFRHSVLRLVEFIVQYLESGGIQNISELMLPHDASQYALKKFSALDMTGDIVILLDDIMYYTSMRHSIYKLSKKYGLHYGQLYFNTPLAECIRRNSLRSGSERIDEAVIVNMAQKMEPPQASNAWEHLSFEVTVDSTVSEVHAFILRVLSSPVVVSDLKDAEAMQKKSQAITAQDVIHQSDLVLRQQVKLSISNASSDGTRCVVEYDITGSHKRALAEQANRCRRLVLDYMRQNSTDVISSLQSGMSLEDDNQKSKLKELIIKLYTEAILKQQ